MIEEADRGYHQCMSFERDLIAFINREIMEGQADDLDSLTPLLELGIIDSISTTMLATHIADNYGVEVSPALLTAEHLQDVRSIAKLVEQLRRCHAPAKERVSVG